MNKTFLEKIKKSLLQQRQEILDRCNKDPSLNAVDIDGDETDEIQGNMLLQVSKQLITRDTHKLSQIESALERISNDLYGICEDCTDDIAEKRLLHNPYFRTCISCAEDRENEEKQRKGC